MRSKVSISTALIDHSERNAKCVPGKCKRACDNDDVKNQATIFDGKPHVISAAQGYPYSIVGHH